MSAESPEAPPAPAPGTLPCARCGVAVPPEQDWCLSCGHAARTRVAPTPRWKVPLLAAALVAALALAALAVSFVDLTKDPKVLPASTAPAPGATTPPAAPATPTTPAPAATTPSPTEEESVGSGGEEAPAPNPTATAPAAPEAPGE